MVLCAMRFPRCLITKCFVMRKKVHSAAGLIELVNEMGMLPLLRLGIEGWSAEDLVDEDCQYVVLPDGGWEWPLWEWKGSVIRESGCAYGKFLLGKAAFISQDLWPDFCNFRRSFNPYPTEGSVQESVLEILKTNGSMTTRDLRRACGFTEPKMRGKFDTIVSRLQMQTYIVTEDFVYPHDKHGKQYGWGWSLLTTPESLFGRDACHVGRSPEASLARLAERMMAVVPQFECEEDCASVLKKMS